jgi:hypothetical protein
VDFVVSLSSPVAAGHTVSVPYVTANGSAQAGLDYAGISGTVVFTAGQSTQTIPVTILNTVASARTLFLKFGKPIGTTLATKKATATIAPAGPVVPPWITAASPSVLMSGAGSVVDVPVSLSSPSTSAVSVPYTTMNKTAIADTDYVAQTGTLTFAPGQTLAHISIPIFPDTQAGPNLVFQVKFKKPVGATLGTLASIVTLVDPVGPMLVYVDNPIVRPASEGQTTQFVVTLSSPITSGRPVLVPYSTMNGSALAGVDYTAVSGTLSYADGQSSLVVPIDILDASVLSARTFSLKFGKATGAALATSKGTTTIAPG